jgi:hypothetical protein
MKRLLFIAALAASTTACVEASNPVQLVRARPLDPETCAKPADNAADLAAGSLDFAYGSSFYIVLGLFSPLTQDQTGNGTGFVADEVIYTYESQGVKATFKEETRPIYLAVPPGATPDDNFLIINLIGTEAAKKLDSLVPTAPDTMTLLSTLKLKGKLASGKSVESNELTFPITITRAGCPSGLNPVATGCNLPQGYTCVSPPP